MLDTQYSNLSEDDKRLNIREKVKEGNFTLNRTALNSGVKNLAEFHNYGYKGLYNGESSNDIAKRKKLRYREDILDNMGSDELAANFFRISQTNQELKKENKKDENKSNDVHYNVGKDIRNFIKKHGGIMPENLLTPEKSLKEIERKKIFKKSIDDNI